MTSACLSASLRCDVDLTCCVHSRDDKRYTEKKNKSERARRKKEDTARLRGIVDTALAVDPRIKRIRQEEKEAREAKKRSKGVNGNSLDAKQQAEEEKRKAEEEAKKKEEEEKVRSVTLALQQSLALRLLTIHADCARRGKEGQGCCCDRCEEGTPTSPCGRWRRGITSVNPSSSFSSLSLPAYVSTIFRLRSVNCDMRLSDSPILPRCTYCIPHSVALLRRACAARPHLM